MHGVSDRVLLRLCWRRRRGRASKRPAHPRRPLDDVPPDRRRPLDQPSDTIQARYQPRPHTPTKLEPFKPLIDARLSEYPQLSGGATAGRDSRRRLSARVRAQFGHSDFALSTLGQGPSPWVRSTRCPEDLAMSRPYLALACCSRSRTASR